MYSSWGGIIGLGKRQSEPWTFGEFETKEVSAPSTSDTGSVVSVKTKIMAKPADDHLIPKSPSSLFFDSRPQTEKLPVSELNQIKPMKDLLYLVFAEDYLDLEIYSSLNPQQKLVADSILKKRFKPSLFQAIEKAYIDRVDCHPHLQQKRVDHCEKSCTTVMMNLLKEKQVKMADHDITRKQDLITAMFKRYFPYWSQPKALVKVMETEQVTRAKLAAVKLMPQMTAVFCIKMGLTAQWFRIVSSKLLKEMSNIDLQEVREFYLSRRITTKLDEIFGKEDGVPLADESWFFKNLFQKTENPKFKLPLSLNELSDCVTLVCSRIKSHRSLTRENELQQFKHRYGEDLYIEKYKEWVGIDLPPLPRIAHRSYSCDESASQGSTC